MLYEDTRAAVFGGLAGGWTVIQVTIRARVQVTWSGEET